MIVEEIQNKSEIPMEMEEGELKLDSAIKNDSKFRKRKNSASSSSDSEKKSKNDIMSSKSLISSDENDEFTITYIPVKKTLMNSGSSGSSSNEPQFKEIKGRNIEIDAEIMMSSKEKSSANAKEPRQKSKFPTCRYLYVIGKCDLGKECKFNHVKLKTQKQLENFLESNLDFLIDFYKNGTLKRLLYPFHQYLVKKARIDPSFLNAKRIKLMDPEPEPVSLEETLNVTYDPKKSPNKNILLMKGGVPVKPAMPIVFPPAQFNAQNPHFMPFPQAFPPLVNNPNLLQNPVHNIQNVHNQQIFISPQPNQQQQQMQMRYQNPAGGMLYNPGLFFYPQTQPVYNPMPMQPFMGMYMNPGAINNQPRPFFNQINPHNGNIITPPANPVAPVSRGKTKKFENKREKRRKRPTRSRSRERDSVKAKKKRRNKSRDRKRKRRKRRSDDRSHSSGKSKKHGSDKEKILSLLKRVETGEESKIGKKKPLLKPDDPRRATMPSSSSDSEPYKSKGGVRSRSRSKRDPKKRKKSRKRKERRSKVPSRSSSKGNSPKDTKREQKRRSLLDKKFMLLFDKNFKEDRKKVEAIKEEIKKEELKYKKKHKPKGKESAEKLGKEFDISEETSEEENKFSEDDEEPQFPHLID